MGLPISSVIAENPAVPVGSRGPSRWLIAFWLLFGVCMGYLTAAVAMSFWSVAAGEEPHQGLFRLIWVFAAVIFFAWPMHVIERLRAVRKQREVWRERVGDLDFEPPTFPMFGTRARGPKADGIEIKAPDIGEGRFRRFLARGRTAEQRMADHLESLELRAEMQKAKAAKSEADPSRDAPD